MYCRDNNFHKPEDVEVNMNMSLTNLCLDYVDLYLMHFPFAYATTDGYATKRRADGSGRVSYSLIFCMLNDWMLIVLIASHRYRGLPCMGQNVARNGGSGCKGKNPTYW